VSLQTLARHVAAVADEPLKRQDELETEARLREMLHVNVAKHFNNPMMSIGLEEWLAKLVIEPAEKSSGDGHLEPENWIMDADGKVWKLQTAGSKLSHHVAYRLPVLWDVAQVIVQWELPPESEKEFCGYVHGAGLRVEPRELAFYKMACAALQLGKCVMFGGAEDVKRQYERRLLRSMGEQFVW
jgi:hypothetical protein